MRKLALCPVRPTFGPSDLLSMNQAEQPCELESVIITDELEARESRTPDLDAEGLATLELLQELAKSPRDFFPKLVSAVLKFSNADSAGVSLLVEERGAFVWPAVAGGLSSFVGAGTPSDFGPCGTVLDLDGTVLFSRPEKHFSYLVPIEPALEEVLLTPFRVDGKAVGTIWAVIHEPGRKFDGEDRRLLENLSEFAASAYRILTETGSLKRILDELPRHETPRRLTNDGSKWQFVEN